MSFTGGMTGKRAGVRHGALYFLLLCGIGWLSARFALPAALSVGAQLLALYGVGRLALKNRRTASLVLSAVAVYITQLSFGLVNSLEAMAFPRLVGSPLLYPLVLLSVLAAFAVCAGCFAAVGRLLDLTGDRRTPYLELLLFPGVFFCAAELYILDTAYSAVPAQSLPADPGRNIALLLLQAAGLAALLCTLYAYRHLCLGFQAQADLRALTQAAQAQRVYIAEARARCERTRSFRHDLKNHLSVLDGLLAGGKPEEGRAYLKKLEAASEALSFPYQTGSPVVDVLLGEKLGLAAEIETEVSLVLPSPCGIDDFDLCVIFSNALDNAIAACRSCEGAGSIRVSGRRQGDFYLLAFENTCPAGPMPPAGTGLSNIRSAAEKYRGTALTEKTGERFTLSVLLNIS